VEGTKAGARSSVWIICALAIVVTPLLAFGELIASSCFMSCGAPAPGAPPPDSGPSVAFIFGIAVSVIGIALSTYTNQVTARMVFGLVLGLTLFIGFLASIDDPTTRTPPHPRVTEGPSCQVHSGSDNTCPGG
jgi:hypothetical protein